MGEPAQHVTYTAKCPCGRDAVYNGTYQPNGGGTDLRIDCDCKAATDAK